MKFIFNVSLLVLRSPLVWMTNVRSIGWLVGIVMLEAATCEILLIMATLPELMLVVCVRFKESE